MSNMQNLETQLDEKERQNQVYHNAVAQIRSDELRKAAGGHGIMAAALGYGESAMGNGTFGKISHAAKLFCIGFAFLVPSLLIWRVLL